MFGAYFDYHLASVEPAGFQQKTSVEASSSCFYIAAFVEKLLQLREVFAPYCPVFGNKTKAGECQTEGGVKYG